MKRLKQLTLILAVITLSASTTSCKKDKENPTISVTMPEQHTEFKWGDEVHIKANFSDDRGLKNYAVTIGNEAGVVNNSFSFMGAGTTTALTFDFHSHFAVPNDAPTMAWVHFVVTDAEDKATTLKWMLHFSE